MQRIQSNAFQYKPQNSPRAGANRILRASKKSPCALCGNPGWPCYAFASGEVVGCKNVPSGRRDRDGLYLHILVEHASPVRAVRPRPAVSTVHAPARASHDHLHLVYSALLSRLRLSPERRARLLARGLSPESVERGDYRDTPMREEAAALVRAVEPLGLEGVPGFYSRGGRARLLNCYPGTFIPYRDSRGRIRGLSYRLDEPLGKTKYLWLSTDPEKTFDDGALKYPGGAKLTPPLHVARPELLPLSNEVLLTEGALKADVVAHLLDVPVIAASGVTQWGGGFAKKFGQTFRGKRAVVAFDSDWRSNEQVRHALERLLTDLCDAGVSLAVRTWPGSAKGFDDYLLSQLSSQEVAA